jgi:alpha-tubulin suppressor-like RCC1 family protein
MHLRSISLALLGSLALAACGGGSSDDAAVASSQNKRQVALAAAVAQQAAGTPVSDAAIQQLLDFAETQYPQYFPSHQASRHLDIWTYRSYPETGVFLGVAFGKVYVLGGSLGEQVTYVGQVLDFITPAAQPTASAATALTGKTPWNISAAAQFSLFDAAGTPVGGPLACSSDAPAALEVAADCSAVKGLRLGAQSVTVSSGGLSAKATIKVIPQAQPLGTNGKAGYNLVVTPDGRVLAWGINSSGALGQGKFSSALPSLSLPTVVKDSTGQATLGGIVAASAGESVAMALTEDGEVYSWGGGDSMGRTALNGDSLPGKVRDATGNATLQHIVAVAVGNDNAVALVDDGTVYSWGYYSGQPGSDPKKVPGLVALPGKAVAVSAGWNWSAVLLADGRVMSWGYTSDGSTGQGAASGTRGTPGFVLDKASGQALAGIVSLSAGYLHGLALTATGQVYGWGRNSYGQLGQNDDVSTYSSAVPVKAPGSSTPWTGLQAVVAGGNQSLAIDGSGKVFSWGYSQNGELGDGANHPRLNASGVPAAVVNAAGIGQLGEIAAIAAGYSHSLALAKDGSLLIWGTGFGGNLGQGGSSTTLSYVPLLVKNEAGTSTLDLAPMSRWPNLLRRGLF